MFEFTENTGLIQYHSLFLLIRENLSIQKITQSTRFMFSIVRVRKLLSNYQQRYLPKNSLGQPFMLEIRNRYVNYSKV